MNQEINFEQLLADMEQQRRLAQLKKNALDEKLLFTCTFETAEDTPVIQVARQYAGKWSEVKKDNIGLYLWGDVGTGKSFAAACIANALLEQGVSLKMTNFSKILNQMGSMYTQERYRYIAALAEYDLLIIDDFGIERNTEYVLEQVYAIIDERYKAQRPLIVTSNLPFQNIRNPQDTMHARIYSRILELCTPVQVRGSDRRAAIGQNKQALVKKLICDR